MPNAQVLRAPRKERTGPLKEREKKRTNLYVGLLIEIEMKSYRTMIWKSSQAQAILSECVCVHEKMKRKLSEVFFFKQKCKKMMEQSGKKEMKTKTAQNAGEIKFEQPWNAKMSVTHRFWRMRKRRNSITEQMVNLRQPTTKTTTMTMTTTSTSVTSTYILFLFFSFSLYKD